MFYEKIAYQPLFQRVGKKESQKKFEEAERAGKEFMDAKTLKNLEALEALEFEKVRRKKRKRLYFYKSSGVSIFVRGWAAELNVARSLRKQNDS